MNDYDRKFQEAEDWHFDELALWSEDGLYLEGTTAWFSDPRFTEDLIQTIHFNYRANYPDRNNPELDPEVTDAL